MGAHVYVCLSSSFISQASLAWFGEHSGTMRRSARHLTTIEVSGLLLPIYVFNKVREAAHRPFSVLKFSPRILSL